MSRDRSRRQIQGAQTHRALPATELRLDELGRRRRLRIRRPSGRACSWTRRRASAPATTAAASSPPTPANRPPRDANGRRARSAAAAWAPARGRAHDPRAGGATSGSAPTVRFLGAPLGLGTRSPPRVRFASVGRTLAPPSALRSGLGSTALFSARVGLSASRATSPGLSTWWPAAPAARPAARRHRPAGSGWSRTTPPPVRVGPQPLGDPRQRVTLPNDRRPVDDVDARNEQPPPHLEAVGSAGQ